MYQIIQGSILRTDNTKKLPSENNSSLLGAHLAHVHSFKYSDASKPETIYIMAFTQIHISSFAFPFPSFPLSWRNPLIGLNVVLVLDRPLPGSLIADRDGFMCSCEGFWERWGEASFSQCLRWMKAEGVSL